MSKQEIYRDFYETIKERVESGLPIWTEALLDCIKENEAALKEVEKEQPKLSIPKKIADMLDQEIVADNITKFAMFHEGFERLWLSDDLTKYCVDYKNYALASVYLAGKVLGVELVEVIDE